MPTERDPLLSSAVSPPKRGQCQGQRGLAVTCAGDQVAFDADAGQVVHQQQHAVYGPGAERRARGLRRVDHRQQALGLDALCRPALDASTAKAGLDDVDRDVAVGDLLAPQRRAGDPALVAVSGCHGLGGLLQAGEVQRTHQPRSDRRLQPLGAEQAVAGKLEAAHRDRHRAGLGQRDLRGGGAGQQRR
jgi:hypothetical protein